MVENEHRLLGIPVASGFHERRKKQTRYILSRGDFADWIEEPEIYTYRFGDYSDTSLLSLQREKRTDEFVLQGMEVYFAEQAEKLLSLKKGKEPVIFLDMGGMLGLSFARVANVFSREVKNSRIAFVVSNLFYDQADLDQEMSRNNQIEGKNPILIALLQNRQEERKAFFNKTRDLVHYIAADASVLRHTNLTLPHEKTVSLKGNVDLLHEKLSMTQWSFVPELEILETASLLSDYGTYVIQKIVGGYLAMEYSETERDEQQQREAGIQLAHRVIQNRYNLRHVSYVESGDKMGTPIARAILFRKPLAPAVSVTG